VPFGPGSIGDGDAGDADRARVGVEDRVAAVGGQIERDRVGREAIGRGNAADPVGSRGPRSGAAAVPGIIGSPARSGSAEEQSEGK